MLPVRGLTINHRIPSQTQLNPLCHVLPDHTLSHSTLHSLIQPHSVSPDMEEDISLSLTASHCSISLHDTGAWGSLLHPPSTRTNTQNMKKLDMRYDVLKEREDARRYTEKSHKEGEGDILTRSTMDDYTCTKFDTQLSLHT